MNGDTLPQTNKGIILVVVLTLAVNATLGVLALAYCLVFKIEPNQVLLTAFISIITGLLGMIGGMLSRTAPTSTPTDATKTLLHALPVLSTATTVNNTTDTSPLSANQ